MQNNIAITPGHHLDPNIAIAACRAGEIGILDLGYRENPDIVRAVINRLAFAAGPRKKWGVRWDTLGAPERGIETLGTYLPMRVPILIVGGLTAEDFSPNGIKLRELVKLKKKVKGLARQILVEVYDLPTAQAAIDAGCDGLIIKGHEAGGWVSPHASYILLQEFYGKLKVPYWLQGGIAFHSAAATIQAGAAGVVLCEQLWLADESPFAETLEAKAWAQLDGSEAILSGPEEMPYRLFSRSGRATIKQLEQTLIKEESWKEALQQNLCNPEGNDPLVPMAQDIAFAGSFAKHYKTVGRILTALRNHITKTLQSTKHQGVFAADSALARLHGTKYPIVQGPMTRVSDVAPFAKAVAEGGGLPFVALSVMLQPQVKKLLTETKALLGDSPWGVGILGFMPLELRQKQLDVIREVKPPFAIIAGGRPGQARELESLGISTYLHVPSPGLLNGFIKDGARKFIFEGSECGGHTGPRTSFILWESAIETLLAADIDDPEAVQVLFAGGIHDALSAEILSTLVAPLVERGMKIGVLMGTAYLFTEEIVNSGAILQEFQKQAIECQETSLLQSGVGIYTRCAKTPFCDEFNRTRRHFMLALESDEKILELLETFNIGRLRIASKGITRNDNPKDADGSDRYLWVDTQIQRREGMYMLGEVARLKRKPLTIAELHAEVAGQNTELSIRDSKRVYPKSALPRTNHEDIAIVGMACILPDADNLRQYWQNIIQRIDAIREVSEDRWRPIDFYDPKRGAPDKVNSKWGGFINDQQFDPRLYGITPASLSSIEPVQLLALDVARLALEDAGFEKRPFSRERTSTIFAQGGMNDLGTIYIFRTLLAQYLPKVPGLSDSAREQIMQALYENELPKYTEDSFPGILGNVVAGRIANRLNLQGSNFTVDAACAASLAALDAGIRQLRSGDADVSLVGAVDGNNNATSFMNFAQTYALSPRGRCRSFDDSADGIVLGEGVAALVLKRLSDAERDGDRIHAVIKGIGSSSDGRNRSMTAPHPQGQVNALQRAYHDAGVDPTTLGLIEAHATGTAVGDRSEITSLNIAFGDSGMDLQSCAVGSVKSMIGHTKVTAGLAGIIKSALALKHKVLPPTIGVEVPNKQIDFSKSPFYVNSETRPWFKNEKGYPRRCGVSAFGFGGTNFHVVMEEYADGYRSTDNENLDYRDAEPFIFWGHDRQHVKQAAADLLQKIEYPEQIDLSQLAFSLHNEQQRARRDNGMRNCRLGLVAISVQDLKDKLQLALKLMEGEKTEFRHPQGVYYQEGAAESGVCFLFPGQGSQKINMLRDLVTAKPRLYRLFEQADAMLNEQLSQALSQYIYPLPVFNDNERKQQQSALTATQVAQPALGVVEMAALQLLDEFGLKADYLAGHSYGEYVALCAAGVIEPEQLLRLSEIRGRLCAEAGEKSPGAMAAVDADEAKLASLMEKHALKIDLANLNSPDQTIIAGNHEAIDTAAKILGSEGLRVTKLSVSAAFHTSAMKQASEQLGAELSQIEFKAATVPVFSNTTSGRYPQTSNEARTLLTRHLIETVRFTDEIKNLHAAGARIFIEVGPGQVLTGLVDKILDGLPHSALPIDIPGRPGWLQLTHLLTRLFVLGVPVQFDSWYQGRGLKPLSVADIFAAAQAKANPGPLVWRINGGRAEPWKKPVSPAKPAIQQAAATTKKPSETAKAAEQPPVHNVTGKAARNFSRQTTPNFRHSTPSRSLNMKDKSASGNTTSPPLNTAAVPKNAPQVAQIQNSISQLLDLQREQQQTLRHFLDFQTTLMSANAGMPGFSSEAFQSEQPQPVAEPDDAFAPAEFNRPPVPAAPALPAQILAAYAGTPATGQVNGSPVEPTANISSSEKPPLSDGANKVMSTSTDTAAAIDKPVADEVPGLLPPTDQFQSDLLRAVSERTGYPEDMLDLEAQMEADLGIDSIKRIEVFSELKDNYNFMEGRDEETVFEELAGHKTLQEIIDWYEQLSHSTPSPVSEVTSLKKALTPSSSAETVESQPEVQPIQVKRYELVTFPAPHEDEETHQPTPGLKTVVLMPPSASSIGEALGKTLSERGCLVQYVVPGATTCALGDNRFQADLSTLESVQQLKALLDVSSGAIGTVINLLGVSSNAEADKNDHSDDATGTFLVCKTLEADLRDSSHLGCGRLINVTTIDGQFGLSKTHSFPPALAATLGIVKSASLEWPDVTVQCIDIEPQLALERGVELILQEWNDPDPNLETGFTQEGRWHLDLQACQEGDKCDGSRLDLDHDSVVVVTGGAYGITAQIAKALAAHYRPRLILLGRSPLPVEESANTRDLKDPAELKQFLIQDLREKNAGKVKPAEVDKIFKRILKEREITANLAAMRTAGSEVEYHALDLRDGESFASLIDDIYAKWGRIDGVLHGAGIIDDKLIKDKSQESFETVFQTKVVPAQVLADKLKPESLKFVLLFSSIAGRFGNSGQCDYSAANEVLNKLADYLGNLWPDVHSVSVNWGPWAGGMVSEELMRMFTSRNIDPIPLDTGVRLCLEELQRHQEASEVLITASLEQIVDQMGHKSRSTPDASEKPDMPPPTKVEKPKLQLTV